MNPFFLAKKIFMQHFCEPKLSSGLLMPVPYGDSKFLVHINWELSGEAAPSNYSMNT